MNPSCPDRTIFCVVGTEDRPTANPYRPGRRTRPRRWTCGAIWPKQERNQSDTDCSRTVVSLLAPLVPVRHGLGRGIAVVAMTPEGSVLMEVPGCGEAR